MWLECAAFQLWKKDWFKRSLIWLLLSVGGYFRIVNYDQIYYLKIYFSSLEKFFKNFKGQRYFASLQKHDKGAKILKCWNSDKFFEASPFHPAKISAVVLSKNWESQKSFPKCKYFSINAGIAKQLQQGPIFSSKETLLLNS